MTAVPAKPLGVAVVVTGEPVESVRQRRGDWFSLMREAVSELAVPLIEVDARTGELSDLTSFDGVIVTGSAASVTERAPWMLETERRLAECVRAGVPLFGVCFGHQMLAQALGGEVQRNPRGREIGTVSFELTGDDPLLSNGERSYLVNMTHVDSVARLPMGAEVLGRTELDPCAALRFGERAWGVQFHPEIDADVMTGYVSARLPLLAQEGLDGARILSEVRQTPVARALLGRFVGEVAGGRGRS
jgi:GMP synthase (glutamine-hydrolysing)